MVALAICGYPDEVGATPWPELREKGILTYAPEVPPPIERSEPAIVSVHLESGRNIVEIKPGVKYEYWTFNGHVPGPMLRLRLGDVLEIHHTNADPKGMPHNLDFHAVTGPGGGAEVTSVTPGEERVARFKMLHPGLFVYHCAAPPVTDHIANGMYGLILVEPEGGLPPVDREFYIMQSEIYAEDPAQAAAGPVEDDFWGDQGEEPLAAGVLPFSHQNGLLEHPSFVFFNGRYGALLGDNALKASKGDRIRIYFGNIGPNLISSFHLIGEMFDQVYREADLISPPGRSIQTTLVPAGGATVVEVDLEVPGTFVLVDHAIFRIEKGAIGQLQVSGAPEPSIYYAVDSEAASATSPDPEDDRR
ncbi:MAG: nitrite reductase, copper-containing [Thermoanaerobaculia bacterium]|nr:nitrite reductase, copper-containing [Thermoanaerobaculia bacterium]